MTSRGKTLNVTSLLTKNHAETHVRRSNTLYRISPVVISGALLTHIEYTIVRNASEVVNQDP